MRKTISAFLLVIGGCAPPCPDPKAHASVKEAESEQITHWGRRFEIFLEHAPLIVNVPTAFVTHVTDLKTFEPRGEGKITFHLGQDGGAPLEHVEEKPARPGIYIPQLAFPKEGEWTLVLRIPVDGMEVVETLPPVHVHAVAEKDHGHTSPEGVSFLKEQQWKLRTRIEPVGTRKMIERIRLPAVVSAKPGFRASVVPPLSGRVLPPAAGVFPSPGARVEAGQVLAFLQPPVSELAVKVVEAEGEIARAKIALSQAELSHARVKKLAASEARTARDLEESEFHLRSAQAAHDASLAVRRAFERTGISTREEHGALPVFELKAPIAGTIVSVGAAVGEQVAEGRAVFGILAVDIVWIEARIAEADVPRVSRSTEAVYETPDAKGRFVPIPGKPVFLGPEVDAATRTVPLVYEAPNPNGQLRVGMSLTVHVETSRAEEALAIPESALVDEEGRPTAYVQLGGETFEKRDLKLGIRDSGFAQVLDGLRAGERIVTSGAYAVRLASVSTAAPAHGHSH